MTNTEKESCCCGGGNSSESQKKVTSEASKAESEANRGIAVNLATAKPKGARDGVSCCTG